MKNKEEEKDWTDITNTLPDKQEEKLNSWFDKIEKSIKSCRNKLHLQVCINMYAQFCLEFPDNDDDQEELLILMEAKNEEITSKFLEMKEVENEG